MCDRDFWCYPRLVPRVTALRAGELLPVCLECVEIANFRRKREGREPIEIPTGAYNSGLSVLEDRKRHKELMVRHKAWVRMMQKRRQRAKAALASSQESENEGT